MYLNVFLYKINIKNVVLSFNLPIILYIATSTWLFFKNAAIYKFLTQKSY